MRNCPTSVVRSGGAIPLLGIWSPCVNYHSIRARKTPARRTEYRGYPERLRLGLFQSVETALNSRESRFETRDLCNGEGGDTGVRKRAGVNVRRRVGVSRRGKRRRLARDRGPRRGRRGVVVRECTHVLGVKNNCAGCAVHARNGGFTAGLYAIEVDRNCTAGGVSGLSGIHRNVRDWFKGHPGPPFC